MYLTAFVADQQLELGAQLNALAVAVRNQTADVRRLALVCLLSVAVTSKPAAPVTRWLPGIAQAERHHLFFRAVHDVALGYLTGASTRQEFARTLELYWRLS